MQAAAIQVTYGDLKPGDRIGDREVKLIVDDPESDTGVLVVFEDHSWARAKMMTLVTITRPEWNEFTRSVFHEVHSVFDPEIDLDKDLIAILFANAAYCVADTAAGPPENSDEEALYHLYAINRIISALELIFHGELSATLQLSP